MSAFDSPSTRGRLAPLLRPEGTHYTQPFPGSTPSFVGLILEPFTAVFSPWRLLPPEPQSEPTRTLRENFADLDAHIRRGTRATSSLLPEYRALKAKGPGLQLSTPAVVALLRGLLCLGVYSPVLEILEGENLVVSEGINLLKTALKGFGEEKRTIASKRLEKVFLEAGRERFGRILFKELTNELTKGPEAPAKVHWSSRRKIDFTPKAVNAMNARTLCGMVDSIIASSYTISKETSSLIAQRFIDLGDARTGALYAVNPLINVRESNFIGMICSALCDRGHYGAAYALIIKALRENQPGLVSDLDMMHGTRSVDRYGEPEKNLYQLWVAMKESKSLDTGDISPRTYAAFLGRATRLKLGSANQWEEGKGQTPLLTMAIEITLRLTDEDKQKYIGLICSMIEAWIWSWRGRRSRQPDLMNLDESIPFMVKFFSTLPPKTLDNAVYTVVERITTNCLRHGGEAWPLPVLWPFIATLAQTEGIWEDEESIGLWSIERVLLRKHLAAVYLKYRTDEEIARFVTRHYLPLRLGITGPGRGSIGTQDAEKIMARLRSLETAQVRFPDLNLFAIAALAFHGTKIPSAILVVDMIYHLHCLGRPWDIVGMLQTLAKYNIRLGGSETAAVIRVLTKSHPECALELLELYPNTQYSTFAQFIASTACNQPSLAISAYRLLTPPSVHLFSTRLSSPPGRRLPKRRLLVAMAWKFANSPVLSPRQCFRYVQKCFQTMMMLKLPPGPRMGLAIAVAGIERAIHANIPLKSEVQRIRWILETIKSTAGMGRVREADVMVRAWEIKVKRYMGFMGRYFRSRRRKIYHRF